MGFGASGNEKTVQSMPDNLLLVYMDIETTGFAKNAEIVQIAAKCEGVNGATFSMYANPLGIIPAMVTEVTGLKMEGCQLFLRDVPISATDLSTVCDNFILFLQELRRPVVLVGHNSFLFDFPRVYRALCDFNLLQQFCNAVCGLADTLKLFRSDKEIVEPSYKQSVLAEKYVPHWNAQEAHEALSDCVTLEMICKALACREKIITSSMLTDTFIEKQICKEQKANLELELRPLLSVLSKTMVSRLAENGMSMQILKDAYRNGQEQSIRMLLAEDNGNGKARITKKPEIIYKLTEYLKETATNTDAAAECI